MNTRGLLRAAGLLIWAFAGIPAVSNIVNERNCSSAGGIATIAFWASAFFFFGLWFFRATRAEIADARTTTRLIAMQTFAALAMNVVLCTGFEAALLVVVSVQLGLALSLRAGLAWMALQSAALFMLAAAHMGAARSIAWTIAIVGAETFAFTVAAIARREAEARRALETTNRALEAARESLMVASRDAERLRIAREIHDLLGHEMIALHLELETARHLAEGAAKAPVDRAHAMGQTLLADLRRAVSTLRAPPEVDLAAEVRAVVERVQHPRIHLDAPDVLAIGDGERATNVIRCVQEVVTNTIKHAAAENLWITIACRGELLELSARDDGRGTSTLVPGHGLEGMRERLSALGGELEIQTHDGGGFQMRAAFPLSTEPA